LTPEAAELVRAGREALRPSDADRERVLGALLPRLGGGPGAEGANTPSTAPAAAGGTIAKAIAALVLISVAGAGLFFALRKEPPPTRPIATAPVASAPVPAPVEPVPERAPSVAPRTEPAEKRAPVAPSPADSLGREVAILSQASAELHAGRPAAALKALDEHRQKFPRGVLAQERSSARIQALCALGRIEEAQAELARLARTSPKSPHVARARKACGPRLTQKE
jgi:TolA-binding protein